MQQNIQQTSNESSYQYQLSLNDRASSWKQDLNSSKLTKIRRLYLGECSIDDTNISVLINLDIPRLNLIDFDQNKISGKGIAIFLERAWTQLETLILNSNRISDEGIQIIAKKLNNQLKQLWVFNNEITEAGMRILTNYNFSNLTKLIIARNNIGSSGAKLLAKANLSNLKQLFAENCQMGNEGITHLTKSYWPQISLLWISKNKASVTAHENLYNLMCKNLNQLYVQEENLFSLNLIKIQSLTYIPRKKILKKTNDTYIQKIFKQIFDSRSPRNKQ